MSVLPCSAFLWICLIGNGANTFLKRLDERLTDKWHTSYRTNMYWIKAKLNFALILEQQY